MDTGKGTFEELYPEGMSEPDIAEAQKRVEARYPNHGAWFREGEEIEIRGSLFRIQSIKPKSMRLKLLKRK